MNGYRSQSVPHQAPYPSSYDHGSYHAASYHQESHLHEPQRLKSRSSSNADGLASQQPLDNVLNNALSNAFNESNSAHSKVHPDIIAQITVEVKKSVLENIKPSRTGQPTSPFQYDEHQLRVLLAPKSVEADSKDDDPSTRRPIVWSPSETSLRGIRCYEVPGTINGVLVDALPDWGSSVDAVSVDFARRHGLRIKAANPQSIRLLGGHIAESVGRIVGQFKFRGERHVHRREFYVLRKSVYDLVLGRKFLNQTKTFTEFCHRIVERVRPCVQKGSRLFLLDESPKDRLRCAINGAKASAIPDTGSELMLVSGDFTRRNNLKVHRGREYRRRVELIDGSTIYTDGMVLNAVLQFDAPPTSS